jgi:Mrp family chromosome partitioning ATPase
MENGRTTAKITSGKPNTSAEESEVLSALGEYLRARSADAQACLSTYEANAPLQLGDEPSNGASYQPFQEVAPTNRRETAPVRPYVAPPPTQQAQERRATAKLDYYKKLAELQQMNLEYGRGAQAIRKETRKEPSHHPHHPLTTSFHVASKRSEPRNVTPQQAAAQPQPAPVSSQRVTAKLDYSRLLEFQRHYEETQNVAIEDRLAVRVAEVARPRLPVRVGQEASAGEAGARLPEARAGQVADFKRGALEQLETPLRQQLPQERVREVLLDPLRIDPHLIALSDLNPQAARYFDQVAVSLISISYKRLCKRVLIASAQHGEGRTSVALNLAGALARARQRVLLVDCDLVNPSVLRLLGIDAPLDLSEAVQRRLGPNSAALRVQPAAFNLLPTREKIQHSAELLASPRFHELLQLCEPDYDFILFDSSPLLESSDANLLASLTDATMLVIRPGVTTTQQMAKAVSLFNERDICGVVLNRVAV